MTCKCPGCGRVFEASSEMFGTEFVCPQCRTVWILDLDDLMRFSFPAEIRVQLVGLDEAPVRLSGVAVFADYGYRVGPLFTDSAGRVVFTKQLAARPQYQYQFSPSERGDYALTRYVLISIPSGDQLKEMAEDRRSSRLDLDISERRQFGSMDGLVNAFLSASNSHLRPAEASIDLLDRPDVVECTLRAAR